VVEATVVDRGERTSDGTGRLPEDEHGRGLHIVAAIAQTFHLVHTPRGSTARLQYHLAAAT
jgi:anti-sigma regulatory factor (Ser/Thr protein kinase)